MVEFPVTLSIKGDAQRPRLRNSKEETMAKKILKDEYDGI